MSLQTLTLPVTPRTSDALFAMTQHKKVLLQNQHLHGEIKHEAHYMDKLEVIFAKC